LNKLSADRSNVEHRSEAMFEDWRFHKQDLLASSMVDGCLCQLHNDSIRHRIDDDNRFAMDDEVENETEISIVDCQALMVNIENLKKTNKEVVLLVCWITLL